MTTICPSITETKTTQRPRSRRATLTWTLAAALAGVLSAASPARACGMHTFMQPQQSPEQLLAQAAQHLRHGRSGSAGLRAHQVIDSWRARPEQRAAAWTVVAWVEWSRGDRAAALASLARGQALNRGAVSTVLAVAPVDAAMKALRVASQA